MANWKSIVKTIAPTVGTALGGPVGGAAIKMIAEKVLGKSDATEAEIEAAILDPNADIARSLRAAENEFTLKMAQLGVDVFGLETQDRSNARELFKVNQWPQIVLSAVFVVGYFVVLTYVLWAWFSGVVIPPEKAGLKDVALMLLGGMTTQMPQVFQFWFGTSHGSQAKTNQLSALAQGGK